MNPDDGAIEIVVCLGSSCFARGNSENLAIINQHVKTHGLNASIRLTGKLCQDECKQGPNLTIGGEHLPRRDCGKDCANCCNSLAVRFGETMEHLNPIYTQERECQDCHKCIRECPVKAIRVEDGYARVVPELCIMCGNCVLACPSNAKRVRDDLPKVKELLTSGRKVIVSLAPSFVAQFSGVRPAQIIHALKKLGFFAVSETALGAQQVSASISRLMRSEPKQIWISSACPVVVDFISKYHPECQPHVFGVLSPLLTHCKMLRAHYGDEIAIVFIGPCIAKKKEAEQHPELLDAVLDL